MGEEFIPYKQSFDMVQLGFTEYVDFYKDSSEEIFDMRTPNDAPCILWQKAFNWLRDSCQLSFHISDYYRKENWKLYGRAYQIFINGEQQIIEGNSSSSVELYFTHPEAELSCLKKLIEIVKIK